MIRPPNLDKVFEVIIAPETPYSGRGGDLVRHIRKLERYVDLVEAELKESKTMLEFERLMRERAECHTCPRPEDG